MILFDFLKKPTKRSQADLSQATLVETLAYLNPAHREAIEQNLQSSSQLRQDLFALSECGFKRNGYFVEFGATDGIEGSNTLLLEQRFDWTGILAEPARIWHPAISKNRKSKVDARCVWASSGKSLEFAECRQPRLSTLSNFKDGDSHRKRRSKSAFYSVETVSLQDLLDEHDAPKHIDYISIDTEGSEFDILNAFDFTQYSFSAITVEHNFTPSRERIFELMSRNGYSRVLTEFSRYDDWYVRRM